MFQLSIALATIVLVSFLATVGMCDAGPEPAGPARRRVPEKSPVFQLVTAVFAIFAVASLAIGSLFLGGRQYDEAMTRMEDTSVRIDVARQRADGIAARVDALGAGRSPEWSTTSDIR